MNAVVRFRLAVLSLVVSLTASGYLFVSFLFPDQAFVLQRLEIRLLVMLVALTAMAVLSWTVLLGGSVGPAPDNPP